MKLKLVAIGTRLDTWINQGFEEYARRLPREQPLQLIEIAPAARRGQNAESLAEDESARLLARITPRDHVVALDVRGKKLSTEALAKRMSDWRMLGADVIFLIGGADGLAPACLERANETLSLSDMTFPHGLARVMLAEQLYRAWTVLSGHPYHRA